MSVEPIEILPPNAIDQVALDRYLRAHLKEYGGGLRVRQFPGGFSNPTYALDATDREGRPRVYVLRKRPGGNMLPSAHRVDREFRVIRALEPTGVPVPRARALCEDPAVLGQNFFVMDRVVGRLFPNPGLPGLSVSDRRAAYDDIIEVMARLHRVDWKAVGLSDYGAAGGFLQRQIDLWKRQYRAAQTDDVPAMDRLGEWLAAHIPPAPRTTIVHGDYRSNNILLEPEAPRVAAILDWELSTLGDPLCDLAYICLCYYLPEPPVGFGNIDPVAIGMPTQNELVQAYASRVDVDALAHWNFYVALQLFKSASILQGVYKRGIEGNAPAAALDNMRHVRSRAALGLQLTKA